MKFGLFNFFTRTMQTCNPKLRQPLFHQILKTLKTTEKLVGQLPQTFQQLGVTFFRSREMHLSKRSPFSQTHVRHWSLNAVTAILLCPALLWYFVNCAYHKVSSNLTQLLKNIKRSFLGIDSSFWKFTKNLTMCIILHSSFSKLDTRVEKGFIHAHTSHIHIIPVSQEYYS